MDSTKKRVRCSNWEEDEKRLLTQLVTERAHIIENKDTSTNTNRMKKASWQEILSCFNSLSNKRRDLAQIQTQWRNTKGKVKSRESEYRRARMMTGGGPPPPSPSVEDLAIIEALPNEFIVDSNEFDSDSVYMNTMKQTKKPENLSDLLISETIDCNKLEPGGSKEVLEESVQVKPGAENLLHATPMSTKSIKRFKPIKMQKQSKINADDYEQQLFLLTKKSKERECERAEEIHKKRLAIMDLEEEFWRKKINSV